MKLSTKSRYAARCLIDLAIYGKERPLSITEIGSREQISERYLELIFATLKKAGFITSARGSQGGYQLIRPIESITIYEIIQLMENDTCIVSKQNETDPMKKMLMREVWTPIDDSLKLYLSELTIAELSLS